MATRTVNFKLTVVGRISVESDPNCNFCLPSLEEVRKTIREVLDMKELKLRSHVDYEDDMRELAEKYGFEKKDLMDLVPSEFVTKENTTIHDHTVEGIHSQARGADASD